MANRDVDELEEELSKKQRLINAWIAVGPEGKTTDVSDLTDSSRGYASDLRRALEGENEDEVELEEVRDAYHPELVEKYRSELGEEAIDGEWEFIERLQRPQEPQQPQQPQREPTETRQRQPQRERQATGGGREGGGREGNQPPGTQQPGQSPTGPGRPPTRPQQPGPQQPSGRGPQQPTPAAQPGQVGQQGGPTPTGQPPGQPGQPAAQYGQPTGGPQTQPQQPVQQQQQLLDQLREFDNSLTLQQQKAQTEINSVPPQSVAQSIAISKYNLIVEIRQSVQELANTVAPGQ